MSSFWMKRIPSVARMLVARSKRVWIFVFKFDFFSQLLFYNLITIRFAEFSQTCSDWNACVGLCSSAAEDQRLKFSAKQAIGKYQYWSIMGISCRSVGIWPKLNRYSVNSIHNLGCRITELKWFDRVPYVSLSERLSLSAIASLIPENHFSPVIWRFLPTSTRWTCKKRGTR